MLKQKIHDEMISAMKAKDQVRLDVLRYIFSQINYAQIDKSFSSPQDKQKELIDEEIITLMEKEVKKRKEAIEMFKKGGKTEGIETEEKQIEIIQSFLPVQLSESDVIKIIDETIASAGPNPHMGKLIGLVMGKVKGKADGGTVASLVRNKLSQEI